MLCACVAPPPGRSKPRSPDPSFKGGGGNSFKDGGASDSFTARRADGADGRDGAGSADESGGGIGERAHSFVVAREPPVMSDLALMSALVDEEEALSARMSDMHDTFRV